MKKLILLFVLFGFLGVGCTHNWNVVLQPNYERVLSPDNQLTKLERKLVFGQGAFADNRSDTSSLVVVKKSGHTYKFHEKPSAEVVFYDELKYLMTSSGHKWLAVDESDVKIDLTFMACNAEAKTGWVFIGATSSLQLKLDFIDTKTNSLIYSSTYSGNGMYRQAMAGLWKNMAMNAIHRSIIKCINDVGDDRRLADALATKSTEK
jgi:hypothetical protein